MNGEIYLAIAFILFILLAAAYDKLSPILDVFFLLLREEREGERDMLNHIHDLRMIQNMGEPEKFMFQLEYLSKVKSPETGVLLSLMVGGFGAHRFYLRENVLGAVYFIFFWTLIPFLVALIEAFLMRNRVEEYNRRMALNITDKIKSLC